MNKHWSLGFIVIPIFWKSGDWKIDTFTSTYIHTLSVWEKYSGSWKLHSSNFLMIDTSMVGIIENMIPFGKINVCFFLQHEAVYIPMKLLASPRVRIIYILDSSNTSSFTFWTSQFTSSSRCNWTGISTGNSNGSWNDKHSSHFSTAKEISVKATFFFM